MPYRAPILPRDCLAGQQYCQRTALQYRSLKQHKASSATAEMIYYPLYYTEIQQYCCVTLAVTINNNALLWHRMMSCRVQIDMATGGFCTICMLHIYEGLRFESMSGILSLIALDNTWDCPNCPGQFTLRFGAPSLIYDMNYSYRIVRITYVLWA